MIWLSTLVLAGAAGWCYRAGGSDKYNTKVRDFGLPTCVILWLLANGLIGWESILTFGLVFGSETSYFKRKGTDATFVNFLLVGLVTSVALFPTAVMHSLWIGYGIRVVTCTIVIPVWNLGCALVMGKSHPKLVQWQEGGRGAWQILTMPMLFIR